MLRACELWWFFFFKQKTAYEMRISDWSSDVCSSDLIQRQRGRRLGQRDLGPGTEDDARSDHPLDPALDGAGGQIYVSAQLRIGEPGVILQQEEDQIGRASCRERVCQYV